MQIINLAIENGIKVYECPILPQHLLSADEILMTNAIRGINWIGEYRNKEYSNNMSRKLVVLLNKYWENQLDL
jgi:branched-chain amino acid aminotransferase